MKPNSAIFKSCISICGNNKYAVSAMKISPSLSGLSMMPIPIAKLGFPPSLIPPCALI